MTNPSDVPVAPWMKDSAKTSPAGATKPRRRKRLVRWLARLCLVSGVLGFQGAFVADDRPWRIRAVSPTWVECVEQVLVLVALVPWKGYGREESAREEVRVTA